jgi:hypothetical protein
MKKAIIGEQLVHEVLCYKARQYVAAANCHSCQYKPGRRSNLRILFGRQHAHKRYPEVATASFPNIVGCSPFIGVRSTMTKFSLVRRSPIWQSAHRNADGIRRADRV